MLSKLINCGSLSGAANYQTITRKFNEAPQLRGIAWQSTSSGSANKRAVYTCSVDFAIGVLENLDTARAKEVMHVISLQLRQIAQNANKTKKTDTTPRQVIIAPRAISSGGTTELHQS